VAPEIDVESAGVCVRLVVEATLGVDFQHVCTAHSNSSARPSHPTRVLDIDGYRVPERWD
jgi:hypothetical protein